MALHPPLSGTRITALFDAGTLVGSAGCNTYEATYTATDGSAALPIGTPTATGRECDTPAGVMDQETAYLALLDQVTQYAIAGDLLHLRDAAGTILLTFRPLAPAPVVDTEWVAVAVGGDPVLEDTELTAVFAADDTVTGSGGCNPYVANYVLDEEAGTLTVADPAAGEDVCDEPAGIMDQEAAFLAALAASATYRALGDRLTLYDGDGTVVLELMTPYVP